MDRAAEAERHAARARAWRAADPERARASVRACHAKHKEKRREACSKRVTTPEYRAAARAAYKENAAKRIERQKVYAAKRLPQIKAYYKKYVAENPDKFRTYHNRRRALKANSTGHHTPEDIVEIRRLQGDRCAVCRCALKGRGCADHIVALVNGGSNDRSNIQLLCTPCNSRKRAKDPLVFMREQGFLL